MNNNQFEFLDLLTIIGFVIAVQNLKENESQSDMLNEHLHEQDGKYLKKIIEQNEQILKILRGDKNGL